MFLAEPVIVKTSVLRFTRSLPVEPESARVEAMPVRLDPSPWNEPEKDPENLGASTEPVMLTVPVKMWVSSALLPNCVEPDS